MTALKFFRASIGAIFVSVFVCFALLAVTSAPTWAQDDPFYDIDGLNPGLGAVPDSIDRSTPRSAMESFLRAADEEDWAAAAHLLDLGALSSADQARDGATLAQKLHMIVERRALLDWSLLVDRPDGLDARASDQDTMGGQPRRSLLLRELALDPVPATLRLNRVRPGGDGTELVWVFPRATVDEIEPLFDRYGPSPFEQMLPSALRAEAVGGLMIWELIGLPLLITLACLAGWLAAFGFRLGRQWLHHASHKLLDAARLPAIIAAVTAVLSWGTQEVFVFSSVLSVFISPLVAVGYTTAALMLVMNGLGAILERLLGPEAADLTHREVAEAREAATRVAALRHILTVLVFVIGAGIVLSSASIFRSFGLSLLASAGALTLIIGFAARQVLGNIMASLQIALNQSARVGDRIMWQDRLCYVEKINFTYILLRNWDDTRVVVPVSEFVTETFDNWTLEDPGIKRILKLKLSPEADVAALREAFNDIMDDMKAGELGSELGDLEEATVNVAGQDALGVDVWFAVPCLDPSTQWEVSCEARERLIKAASQIAEQTGRAVFPEGAALDAAA
ncbi:mechanosensitive ion channel family protein [Jannaschia sp. CCS1]|uniref:mechanosensitive ion channel family protein n=1 Tax=Jannaschia sp. (strain CCS1) TaxID=290400 RepID=UPI000053A882|nr:mechanosensitive ion channel domain-containing protein [Jannaschia sp. CCS1]ABD55444.1 MscS Mechanosensitive ion channel [Jannaschia sp. CCS1]